MADLKPHDAEEILGNIRFHQVLSQSSQAFIRGVGTGKIGPAQFADTFPLWLRYGGDTYLKLFQVAQFVCASMGVGQSLDTPISLERGLRLFQEYGQMHPKAAPNEEMASRGFRWQMEFWKLIATDVDIHDDFYQTDLDNALFRIRNNRIPAINPYDLLTVMLASQSERNRLFLEGFEPHFPGQMRPSWSKIPSNKQKILDDVESTQHPVSD